MERLWEDVKIVRGWAPVDVNANAQDSDIVSMKGYERACILLDFGATDSGADVDIAIKASNDVSGSQTASINNFYFRKMTSGDTWGDPTKITDSKLDYVAAGDIVPDTDDNCLVAIDIDAAQVRGASSTYEMDCLQVQFPDPSNATIVGCLILLYNPRYGGDEMPTAITD